MADLEQLKQKYAPVIDTIEVREYGAKSKQSISRRTTPHQRNRAVPGRRQSRVGAIKQVDPSYSDLKHEIATTGGAEQPYTIKSGDSLSEVSKLFYGNANKYRNRPGQQPGRSQQRPGRHHAQPSRHQLGKV